MVSFTVFTLRELLTGCMTTHTKVMPADGACSFGWLVFRWMPSSENCFTALKQNQRDIV